MQSTFMYTTKAKFFTAIGTLLLIIIFAGGHMFIDATGTLQKLNRAKELRALSDTADEISENIDDLIILNAQIGMDMGPVKEDLLNRLHQSIAETEKLADIDQSRYTKINEDLNNAYSVLNSAKPSAVSVKKSFFYLGSALNNTRALEEDLAGKMRSAREAVINALDNNPTSMLWIPLIALGLIFILIYVIVREIFMPMQRITGSILHAGMDTDNILNYIVEDDCHGEAGRAQHALNRLYIHVAENFQRIRDANANAARQMMAIEAVHNGVGMINQDGLLTYGNKALFVNHGINEEDSSLYIGQPWTDLYTEKGKIDIASFVIPEILQTGLWEGQVDVLGKDKNLRQMDATLTRLNDGSMIGTVHDITGRKRAENESAELQKMLSQAQKMEAVGRLTGGVAHDFNNILTVIDGNLDLLKDYCHEMTAAGHKNIATAQRAVLRGAELTQRLLSFSRKQVLAPRVLNFNSVLPESLSLISQAIGEDIDLDFEMAETLWDINIDVGQFENALLNIVINARDAMPDGGQITILTENIQLNGSESEGLFDINPGSYVKIAVSDTGSGIPHDVIAHVFEPFFTTKEPGKGTGLGLSMVYGFTKQSNGYCFIESEEGIGTRVSLCFPRYESGHEIEEQSIPGPYSLTRGNETILIAEDEEDLLDLNKTMLTRLGYHVICARNGVEALKIVRSSEPIDLIITDMVMPGGVSGKDLAEKARILRPEIKVLVVSGYTNGQAIREDDALKFFSKPFTQSRLIREVDSLLGHYQNEYRANNGA